MSASDTMETNILKLLFQNVDFANIGDATGLRGASTPGSLYISLHTSDPGETGSQASNETAYTSYARVAVARSAAAWDVTGAVASNIAAVSFPTCTGGTATVTHVGIGTSSSGAGTLLFSAALAASLAVSNTVQPEFAIGQFTVTAS